jgi:hypothetical protein
LRIHILRRQNDGNNGDQLDLLKCFFHSPFAFMFSTPNVES